MILLHPAIKTSLDYVLVDSPQTIAVSGENGIGKAYVACYIAYSLLDTDMSGLDAHPYVLRLDAKNKAGIEDVRDIQRQISTKVPSSRSVNRPALASERWSAELGALVEGPSGREGRLGPVILTSQATAEFPTSALRAKPCAQGIPSGEAQISALRTSGASHKPYHQLPSNPTDATRHS